MVSLALHHDEMLKSIIGLSMEDSFRAAGKMVSERLVLV